MEYESVRCVCSQSRQQVVVIKWGWSISNRKIGFNQLIQKNIIAMDGLKFTKKDVISHGA